MAKSPSVKVDLDFTPMFAKLELLGSTFADMGAMLVELSNEIAESLIALKGEE